MEITNADDIQRLSESLLKKYAFQAILITRGEEGMSLFENGRKIVHTYFSTQAKEVYDVTGAGDTVIGTLALGLAARANIKRSDMFGLIWPRVSWSEKSARPLFHRKN